MKYTRLTCRNCGNHFVWSEEEQRIYAERKLPDPKYCPICRGMMEAREKDVSRSKYER